MKKGIVKNILPLISRPILWLAPGEWIETNVEGDCLLKTRTLVIKLWAGTEPGAYNVESPSRLIIK